MNGQPELEAWVRSHLAAIAESVAPLPDPYGRLLRRRRFDWLRRGAVACLAALATAAAATAIALSPAGPPPTPVDSLAWIDSLVDGPARGGLAGDEQFRRDMQDRITAIVRSGEYQPDLVAIDGMMRAEQEVRLLFADDIDDRRVAALALRLAEAPDPDAPFVQGPGRTRVVWVSGPRGASPDVLASALTADPAPDVDAGSDLGEPLTIVRADEPAAGQAPESAPAREVTWVGLAPPTCTVLAAPAADPAAWTPEPTHSYIVRSPANYRAEYWRVTCNGVVREQRTVPWSRTAPTTHDVEAQALADLTAAGVPDGPAADDPVRLETLQAARAFDSSLGPFLAGPPRVLRYVAAPPGLDTPLTQPSVVVLAAPTTRSTWQCTFTVMGTADANRWTSDSTDASTTSDPFAAGAMLAASVATGPGVHVIATVTPAAATAQLQDPNGVVLSTSMVLDGLAVLAVAAQYTTTSDVTGGLTAVDGLRVAAFDATGSLITTSPVLRELSSDNDPVRALTMRPNWGD